MKKKTKSIGKFYITDKHQLTEREYALIVLYYIARSIHAIEKIHMKKNPVIAYGISKALDIVLQNAMRIIELDNKEKEK